MNPENKTFYQDPGDTTEFAGSDSYPGVVHVKGEEKQEVKFIDSNATVSIEKNE